jgi:hypothetical protein
MMLSRRVFLAGAASAPFIYGLRELLSQEPKWEPDWYALARGRMKETGRFGVVLVVPDDKAGRERLGNALQALIEDEAEGPRELFCEAVFVCVTPEIARACVREAGERENRFLISPEGKRLAASKYQIALLEDPGWFLKSFGEFVHGDKGERLKERAGAIRAGLGEDVKRALSSLDADTVEERDEASALLQTEAEKIAPLLVETRVTSSNEEVQARCRAILRKSFESKAPAAPPRLPFGCTLENPQPPRDTCAACGIAVIREDARKLLRFLTK